MTLPDDFETIRRALPYPGHKSSSRIFSALERIENATFSRDLRAVRILDAYAKKHSTRWACGVTPFAGGGFACGVGPTDSYGNFSHRFEADTAEKARIATADELAAADPSLLEGL